jgi:hypothetical protein
MIAGVARGRPDGLAGMLAERRRDVDCFIGVVNAVEAPRDRRLVQQDVRDVREQIERGDSGDDVRPGGEL